MYQTVNVSGYYLYSIGIDEWIFNIKGGPLFTGSFKEVVKYCVQRHGFEIDEIDNAVKWMIEFNHDSIHFGAYKTMIFTFNRTEKEAA